MAIPGGQLIGVQIGIELSGPNGILTSDGRITVNSVVVVNPGHAYRRSVTFSSLTAEDSGSYTCTVTVTPTNGNAMTTSATALRSGSLTVNSPGIHTYSYQCIKIACFSSLRDCGYTLYVLAVI